MDQKVLEAQQWVNATYGQLAGYVACSEDGNTGWPVMYSLTMGLQHELGITSLSANFGPTTLSDLTAHGVIDTGESNTNLVKIVQYGLFCKGYWGGDTPGQYDDSTFEAVQSLQSNAGIGTSGQVSAKLLKAILTMDAYVVLSGGSNDVRSIQQWLNGRYFAGRDNFYLIPCDGFFSRGVQTALMQAIQYELGVPTDSATGNFGPTTQAGLRANVVSSGSTGVFVQLFSAAMVFNNASDDFTATFNSDLVTDVTTFQTFSALAVSGEGDYETWCQLLVSMGDVDRPATAVDCVETITSERAATLLSDGYTIVGRYLDERPSPNYLNKKIQPGELDVIFGNGMRVFPISQYSGGSVSYFTYGQGYTDAQDAHTAAVGYGFDPGTVIYFAVDYDATDDDITDNIVPYFLGVSGGLASMGRRYIHGAYGSRNVCVRAMNEAYAAYSFVSGMSWGFSGNLGYPMPKNWAFNQIETLSLGSGTGAIDVDKDVHNSQADSGVSEVNSPDSPIDQFLTYLNTLYLTAVDYGTGDPNVLVLDYLRATQYIGFPWNTVLDDPTSAWLDYADAHIPAKVMSYTDPAAGISIQVDHLAYVAAGVLADGAGPADGANLGDLTGWGGDLCSFYAEWRMNSDTTASGYDFCTQRLAKIGVASTFGFDDLISDVDGYLIGMELRNGVETNVAAAFTNMLQGGGANTRFRDFYTLRHDSVASHVTDAAGDMLLSADPTIVTLREAIIEKTADYSLIALPSALTSDELQAFQQGYSDTLVGLVNQEPAMVKAQRAKQEAARRTAAKAVGRNG